MLSGTWWDCWGVCARPGVGLDDPCGSLPTHYIVWFYGSYTQTSQSQVIKPRHFSFDMLHQGEGCCLISPCPPRQSAVFSMNTMIPLGAQQQHSPIYGIHFNQSLLTSL